jgi:hypothetical protein
MIHELSKKMTDQRRKEKLCTCTISASTYLVPEALLITLGGAMFGSIENPIALRKREVHNGSFTEQCTSSPSSSWSRVRHVWHVRTPRGHPRWSLLNTQGTCRRQSSCEPPHPKQIKVSHYIKGVFSADPIQLFFAEGFALQRCILLPARE